MERFEVACSAKRQQFDESVMPLTRVSDASAPRDAGGAGTFLGCAAIPREIVLGKRAEVRHQRLGDYGHILLQHS